MGYFHLVQVGQAVRVLDLIGDKVISCLLSFSSCVGEGIIRCKNKCRHGYIPVKLIYEDGGLARFDPQAIVS